MLNTGHGGNLNVLAELAKCTPGEILDFSFNINPFARVKLPKLN